MRATAQPALALIVGLVGLAPAAHAEPQNRSLKSLFSRNDSSKEEWQILCGKYEGDDRIRTADDLAAALKRVRGIDPKKVRVVHHSHVSRITYGPYPLGYDERGTIVFSPEIQRDLKLIRSLSVNEQFPFFTALKQPAPTPDVGPPEWDLRRCRGVYSLNIGVFYNTPRFRERKEAAVEWVRDLRKRGHEAYYYHDTKMSHVTVGSFDESAFLQKKLQDRSAEVLVQQGHTRDYSQDVIKLMRNPEFSYNLVNGAKEIVDRVPQVSFLVRVPHTEAGSGRDDRP